MGVCVCEREIVCVPVCFFALSSYVLGQLTSSKLGSAQQQRFEPATKWFSEQQGSVDIVNIHSCGMLCRAVNGAAANLAG